VKLFISVSLKTKREVRRRVAAGSRLRHEAEEPVSRQPA
jgi:hypothetical protein